MVLGGLEPGVQYILAIGLVVYWMISSVSRAYERVTRSRSEASSSRRAADLAETRHRDAQAAGLLRLASHMDWGQEGRDR